MTDAATIDRAAHHVAPPREPLDGMPPSLPLPIARIDARQGEPLFAREDPWKPLQIRSAVVAAPPATALSPPPMDPVVSAQLAAVAGSRKRLDRAHAYVGRLDAHAVEIRAKLATAVGNAEPDAADAGPLRRELIEVDRQRRQAIAALAEIEAEHARHEADLAVLAGPEGAARGKLQEAHDERVLAQTAADDAKALLDRATAHAEAVSRKLDEARSDEAQRDAAATARLRAAFADGDVPPLAAEAFTRASAALEDDLGTARGVVDQFAADHKIRLDALAEVERAVAAAVDEVLLAEADAMARELATLDARAALLRGHLSAYAERTPGDWIAPVVTIPPARQDPGGWMVRDPAPRVIVPKVRQTPEIVAALASAPGAPRATDPAAASAWTSYATALKRDADAAPGLVATRV